MPSAAGEPEPAHAAQQNGLRWLWLSGLVLLLDQISKHYAELNLALYQPVKVMPSLNFTLMYNEGAAFSFLSSAGGWQRWLFSALAAVVSIGIVWWLKRTGPNEKTLATSLALILGGALGNLSDRLLYGHVVDFLDVYYADWHWPAFNIADSAITIGAALMLVDSFFGRREET